VCPRGTQILHAAINFKQQNLNLPNKSTTSRILTNSKIPLKVKGQCQMSPEYKHLYQFPTKLYQFLISSFWAIVQTVIDKNALHRWHVPVG